MSLIVFTMINLVGDPVDMLVNPESLPEEIERVRSDFGLDKPIHIQYWKFLKGALSGDLGNSFILEDLHLHLFLSDSLLLLNLLYVP